MDLAEGGSVVGAEEQGGGAKVEPHGDVAESPAGEVAMGQQGRCLWAGLDEASLEKGLIVGRRRDFPGHDGAERGERLIRAEEGEVSRRAGGIGGAGGVVAQYANPWVGWLSEAAAALGRIHANPKIFR